MSPKRDAVEERLWGVRFAVTRPLGSLPRPVSVGSGRVTDPIYYHEGRRRGTSTSCLFQYSLSGEGRFFDSRGDHRVPAGSGFLCKISDPATGYYYPRGSTAPWVHVHVGLQGVDAMVRELVSRFGAVYRVAPELPMIRRLLEYELQGWSGRPVELTPGEALSLANGLLATLADVGAEETRDTPNAWLVREARRWVRARVEARFNAGDLSRALGVSHEHLCRVFQRELGVSPLRYLTEVKMRYACDLLRDTALSCKQVCHRLGYDTASHFARTFRRVMGTTPMQYRRYGAGPF